MARSLAAHHLYQRKGRKKMQTSENAMTDKMKSDFAKADKSGHVDKTTVSLPELDLMAIGTLAAFRKMPNA